MHDWRLVRSKGNWQYGYIEDVWDTRKWIAEVGQQRLHVFLHAAAIFLSPDFRMLLKTVLPMHESASAADRCRDLGSEAVATARPTVELHA